MSRREVLFAIYKGEYGGPVAVVLAAFTLDDDVLMIVQLADHFEIWTLRSLLGHNYTFRNRTMGGIRQPLGMLVMSWLQSQPGDLCLLPEYIDTSATPVSLPSKEEFQNMWTGSGRLQTMDELRELMTMWMFQSYCCPLFVNSEVSVVTPQSFTNLREQYMQICSACPDCQVADMRICVQDPVISYQHTMCKNHLFVFVEQHTQLLEGALALQPTYKPECVLCPWCRAYVDTSTLALLNLEDSKFVELVIKLHSLLQQ